MARNTMTFTATDGRDAGKKFFITEMSAAEIEDWAAEAFFLLIGAGVEIPEDSEKMGMAALLSLGFDSLGKVPYAQMKPLFNRMLNGVQAMPDPNNPNVLRALVESDTEEVSTRLKLRKAVWDLNTGFFTAGAR